MNYKSYNDLSNDIYKNISRLHAYNFDLIVGIPRSGMIPSYMIALALNIDCIDLPNFLRNEVLGRGITRKSRNTFTTPWDAKKILLVDDSISTGGSMEEAFNQIPNHLKNKITKLAIYSSSSNPKITDIHFEKVLQPRVFEWNIYHHNVLAHAAVDIDGVLCRDPTPEQNDDGEKYREFLLTAEPLFLPTGKIHSLVTNRLEKYRTETEIWLKSKGIIYDKLLMLDLPTKEDRQKLPANYLHKARHYKNPELKFFIESESTQALGILKLTGKPVFCTETNKIYSDITLAILYKNPSNLGALLKQKLITIISKTLPVPLKVQIKKLIKNQ